MMKKALICVVCSACLFFAGCTKTVSSTDLSSVEVDGIKLYDAMSSIDTTSYTATDRFTVDKNTAAFEELRITVDENGAVTAITAEFSQLPIRVKNQEALYKIDAIEELLGEAYIEDWQDKEQYLKRRTYLDDTNNIQANFVYHGYTNDLVWLVLKPNS